MQRSVPLWNPRLTQVCEPAARPSHCSSPSTTLLPHLVGVVGATGVPGAVDVAGMVGVLELVDVAGVVAAPPASPVLLEDADSNSSVRPHPITSNTPKLNVRTDGSMGDSSA
jgi:hypothetical protein